MNDMQPDPAIRETTQCLCLAARRASRTITREFDRALRAHGLRATQFTLLAALHLAGPRPIGALAELLSLDRTTLTRNLAVAEQHGWVTTRADREDERSRIAAISAKGLRTLTAALPAWRRTQGALIDTIGQESAASLRKLAGGPCASPARAPSRPASLSRKRLSNSDAVVRHQTDIA
ncbi:MAG: hypothetical protein OJF55_001716 [Rhodanobacteraceae bacterium]|jgi:DNA-binding MarR family transcriptional regulator|nr:MAG: hypothetical protein OJF55_001716 [Rhodanobacteraceae bacterium]